MIELLFVLTILSILMFISVPAMYHVYVEQQTKQFFNVLDSDVLYIQNQALGENNQMRILFEKDRYSVLKQEKVVSVRRYPEHISKVSSHRVTFNRLGTVRQPASFLLYDQNDMIYSVVFPLGKGRHYIEEQ